ncbi:chromosome segregation protein SMC [Schlesneria paludicola]|uniref:chromosome segregation protein SMC n=1 Tax=Schlesneria paludicola TaxID=360056 RepID=UPI000299D8A1|nr:chromosome segregation protein SMC [Schlesneria paludicola]
MLKSLELFGFKSFADRTRFDFSTGINCVVGPNGSGKSNVVDGMKWILGDQSAKSLRGKEMTDVIFNGSASRKPSAFAEATLTFDNSGGLLPLDMQEVQIGRRIWRNGDAEYLLNRAPARLKDIKDLFLGTGAGTAAYSIIEQGRVDQILQGSSATRRSVFEEAAGISRFKTRKIDAQRKLERVGQNLERLTDIVDEVEAQLNATRSQAAKAAKFHDVSTALKKWWLGLAADDFRHLSVELEAIEKQLVESSRRLGELGEQQKVFEAREAAFDAELAKYDEQLRDVERRNSGGREAIAGHEATIQFQTARLQELESELARLQRQQFMLGRRARETRLEIAGQQDRLIEFEQENSACQRRVVEHEQDVVLAARELAVRRDQLERDHARRLELTKLVSDTANAVTMLQANVATLRSNQQKIISQLDALDGTIAERDLERAQGLRRVEEASQSQQLALQNLRSSQLNRANLLGVQEETKRTLAECRERRSAAHARKSLLEDLELRQEGLGIGVKEILTRARTSPSPPWNSIVGSVAELLDVDLERAALLEVALGPRAQLIVLREYQALLDYLNQGTVLLTNRIGFIAIPDRSISQSIAPVQHGDRFVHLQLDPEKLPDLSREPGVVMRADQLILSDRGIIGLAPAVLSDTWIVETIDVALRLAVGPGIGLRFVTMQGELLEANGSLFVGTIRTETSLLSRKSELRRLKNDLTLLDRDIATAEQSLQSMYQSLTGADSELEALAAELDYANQRLADLKSELSAQDQTLERLNRERQMLAQQLLDGDEALTRHEEEYAIALQQATTTDEELQNLVASLTVRGDEVASLEQQHRQLEQQKSELQLELVKQAERLESLKSQEGRLKEELQQRMAQHEEAERRYGTSFAQCERILLQILNTRAARDERMLVAEQIQSILHGLENEKRALRIERSQFVEQELALRKQRRELEDRHHGNEIRVREMKSNLAGLDERLEEEYQLKLVDVVESGVSALGMLIEERNSKPSHRHKARKEKEEESHANEGETTEPEIAADDAHIEPLPATVDDTHHETAMSVVDNGLPLLFSEARPELDARVNRLRKQLKMMGAVNTDSLRDLEMQENRFTQLSAQLQDLVEAKQTLEDIIRKINAESRRLFLETFETIRNNFRDLFRQVFGGGEGDIVLEDPDDILDCGIDIAARPPGKELRSISLLSGGEKTMTAIALIMSIFKSKPSPFCILDEVDAALDEANVERFTAVVKAFQQTTQFIMITHHKRSMTVADVLYGVTMEESGISKRMSVRFEDVSDDGNFKPSAQPSAA